MIEWGAPIGFEGDAERAVRFANELRRRHRTLRIGASYGVAFTGLIGPPAHEEFAIVGAHVNLAARLMASAARGRAPDRAGARGPRSRPLRDPPTRNPHAAGDRRSGRAQRRARRGVGGSRPAAARADPRPRWS